MTKLPFSQQEHLQIFPTFLAMLIMCASLRICVRERPKNIFCYQRDEENSTDQVLDFLLFDRYEYTHGIFQPVILVSLFLLQVYVTFSLFFKI